MKRVFVTGATGFVGNVLCDVLVRSGYVVRAAVRDLRRTPACVSEPVTIGDIGSNTDWREAVSGVDSVIHIAARAHVLRDSRARADLYMETNARGTLNLATQAAQAGVHRFIFLSSVKVNGEVTSVRPINSTDNPQPGDAYGESKWEGEKFALMVAARSAMEVAIIRSPLIYGPGVKANFLRLMQWVDNERLVPLGAVDNKRSLVSVWNLCDLILHLLTNPAASRRIWMVSDGEDLSTPQLIRRLATAMGRRVRMLPVPVSVLRCLGSCLGYGEEVTRLCGSLTVDIAQTRSDLGWSPPLSVDEALERTVRWYLSAAASHVD